jgi:hypothetical protein
LTGELIPTTGDVYTHENIRIAYIKQHAFAHIDHHLEKTPSEYIQWRFQTGEDRETMDRANKIVTDEDEKAMDKIYKIEGTTTTCHWHPLPTQVQELLRVRVFVRSRRERWPEEREVDPHDDCRQRLDSSYRDLGFPSEDGC